MPYEKGFSLFETLIALSIVSILAVIAVPMYLNYDVRAKITEGFSLAGPVKNMVADYYETTGTWPSSNLEAGVETPSSYTTDNIESIKVAKYNASAAIIITYRIPALDGNNTIILVPTQATGQSIQWSCTQGTVIDKYRPTACKA
jgi:type IV pilus assembly protein PilA